MYNLGLEVLRPPVGEIPDDWSFEQFYELSYELEKGLEAVSNIITIRHSVLKYGKTRQLVELVGASFESANITFSNEGFIESVKNFFVWIKEKIVALWKWFWGLFGFYKNEKDAIKEVTKAAADVANATSKEDKKKKQGVFKSAYNKLKGFFGGAAKGPSSEAFGYSLESNNESVTVNILDFKKVEDTFQVPLTLFEIEINQITSLTKSSGKITDKHIADIEDVYERMKKLKERRADVFLREEKTMSNNEALDVMTKSFDIYVNMDKGLASAQTALKKLEDRVNEIERALVGDPDNYAFTSASKFLKTSINIQTLYINAIIDIRHNLAKSVLNIAKNVAEI